MSVPGPDRRALLKEALEAVERLQARVNALESGRVEPIAIIGLACRFPGGASTPEAYWALLRDGIDAITEVPADRWDASTWARVAQSGGATPKFYGGFLEGIDCFDARFFGISPREARTMDPQQRLLLEVVWEALERAGQAPDRLAGSRTGVFVGITTSDYGDMVKEAGGEGLDVYVATGSAHNAAAGRISYVLGLRGPCMAIDTACSSSLTAVHLACQSLRTGESRMALAGGVNAILTPDPFVIFSRWGMMAPDGRCKTFDARADGFVRGEGCGIVVLKRLGDALADGDTVLAVIRGSAVNQDGASSGLTVPSGLAQQEVVRQALAGAGVAPADVSYIEAHGTGTALGDPIELEALLAVLGPGRPADRPLTVGSVKTNLGHLESASGVAGLIKVVLALQHGEIPPHLHFTALTPKVTPDPVTLVVPTARTPWPAGSAPRTAGVSSFGFSGTNAHVIVAEAPPPPARPDAPERPHHLLVLSARSDAALDAQAARLARRVEETGDAALADTCFTLATGRARLSRRLALPVTSAAQAREALTAAAAGRPGADVAHGRARAARPRIAFLFTGQGSQYAGMGRALHAACSPFREALERCERILAAHLDRPLRSLLAPEPGSEALLDATIYTQPALFALEYALAETWRAWGVTPTLVLGHSVGEYVAACVAGVLGLEDALATIAARGRLMQALPAGGAMAAVLADEATVARAIAPHAAVAIAAVNSPDSVVVAGDGAAVAAVRERLKADGIKSQPLVVSHAFHSPLMEPMLDDFEAVVARATLQAPRIGFVSNVTGRLAGPDELRDPRYWRRHVRQTVRFADGVAALQAAGAEVFVEVGPSPTLLGLARRCLPEAPGPWLPSLRKGRDDWAQMLETLGALWVEGVEVDWAAFDRPYGRRRVALPSYPFQRERCWIERTPPASSTPTPPADSHPLLGRRLPLAGVTGTAVWESGLSLARLPYLADHRVQGRAIVPATAYLEMTLAAASEILGAEAVDIDAVTLHRPIFLGDEDVHRVQLTLQRDDDDHASVQIHGTSGRDAAAAWSLLVTARVARGTDAAASARLDDVRARCPDAVAGDVFYARLAERGNEWGPTFRGLATVWRGADEALSEVRVPDALAPDCPRYRLHPALADAAGHVLVATIPLEASAGPLGGAFVGGGIERIRFHRAPRGATLWAHAHRRRAEGDAANVLCGDVTLYDEQGLVSELEGARLWYLDAPAAGADIEDWLYEVTWPRRSRVGAAPVSATGAWLVMVDSADAGDRLAAALTAAGARCIVAVPGERYARLASDRYAVRPAERDDVVRLLVDGAADLGAPWAGIAHMWTLSAPTPDQLTADALDAAGARLCGSVAALVAAIESLRLTTPPRVWLVSRGAQPVGGERAALAIAQSPLWGLGRSLAMEHSDLWGGLVDLDPDVPAAEAMVALAAEMLAPDGEDQIAFRGGERHAARLTRRSCPEPQAGVTCRADATYIVTGGLGGLGLLVARWLVERGARHLALLGRSGLGPHDRRHAVIEGMRDVGATVRVVPADVGDATSVTTLLDGLRADGWPAVRGVVHAAGIMRYRPLVDTTAADVTDVLRAKVRGAWLLHAALTGTPLDFFVLFSSASAVLSSGMIALYAAGNAFLDALAHHRVARGLPAVSIDWGLWTGAGMAEAADATAVGTMAARGMGSIEPERGLHALARVLAAAPIQIAVLPTDWARLRDHYPAFSAAPLLERLNAERVAPPATVSTAAAEVRTASPEERRRRLPAFVAGELATVLRLDPAGVDLAASIGGLGLDSLMSVELKNRLERALGVSVPMARLLEGPTVLELAEELAGKMGVAAAAAAPAVDVVTAPAGVIEDGVLSIGQQALWFMHHLAPDSPAYNVVFATRLRSCVDVDRLERTLALVVERHPMLGTVFVAEAGKASQRPGGRLPKIERIDATGQDAATLSASVYAAAREPFDLGQAVLRARLFSVSADEHVLLLVVHHIVFDAWSFELLFRDLCTAYEALAAGRSPAWAPVPARYADFARWQRDLLAGEAGVAQRRYWEAELAGELPTLDVKAAKPRPVVRAFRGASVSFALPAELTRHVKALASREGMTPYMLIAAAYAQLLHQESGQEDILIGTPVAGRSRAEFTGVVGYFVNMLVLRLRVCGTAPGALLRQVRDKVLGALDHQDYPFALLIRSVRTTRDPARTPVFQAAFNFVRAQQVGDLSHFFIEGVPGESLRVGDLVMEPYPIPQQEGQFELELEVADTPGALCGRLKYDPDVYDRPTIERLVVDFERALERLAPSDSGEREELEL